MAVASDLPLRLTRAELAAFWRVRMSRPNTRACKTLNWPACSKALKCGGTLAIWFDPDVAWAAKPTGKRGRHPVCSDAAVQTVCSDAAVQTCLPMKVLSGMALRQRTGFVASLPCMIGLHRDVPDFSTLSRRRTTLAVNIPYRGSQGPLQLLIDSTGIKVAVARNEALRASGVKHHREADYNVGGLRSIGKDCALSCA